MSHETTGSFDPSAIGGNFGAQPQIIERVGVQPRDPEFGDGITQRVYEIQYGEHVFGVNFGDIAQVPTEAVMLPSTPWLGIGGGAIENVLHDAIGGSVFDSYADMIRSSLERSAHLPEGPEKTAIRAGLAERLASATGMDADNATNVAARLTGGSYMADLGGRHSIELEYGEAVPCVPGNLSDKGINSVVVVNVTPSAAPGREQGMTSAHMAMFTRNAAKVAAQMGARSVTIPAVGTGFAAALGFGMSMADSMRGFFDGAKQFVDSGEAEGLQRIDFNIYARPSEEGATQVAEFVRDEAILDRLAA